MQIDICQLQRLLKGLGEDPGVIDGYWGPNSQKALDSACSKYIESSSFDQLVEETLPSTKEDTVTSSELSWWTDIKYFNRSEFRCQCGGKYCNGYAYEPQEKLIRIADEIRKECGAAAHVTSGLRCTKHNAEVGGVANSAHITGKAMDFYIDGLTADALLNKVQKKSGIAYAYKVTDRVVHMNI